MILGDMVEISRERDKRLERGLGYSGVDGSRYVKMKIFGEGVKRSMYLVNEEVYYYNDNSLFL